MERVRVIRRNEQFFWPHQVKGFPVKTRFSLRKGSNMRPIAKDQSIFSYDSPGRQPSGESGRMGQGGASY